MSQPAQNNIFVSDNILYKFTNPSEYIFTFSNDSSDKSIREGSSPHLPGNN